MNVTFHILQGETCFRSGEQKDQYTFVRSIVLQNLCLLITVYLLLNTIVVVHLATLVSALSIGLHLRTLQIFFGQCVDLGNGEICV